MTVTLTTPPRKDYTGTNSTDTFPYDFPVSSPSDLRVVERNASGIEHKLTLDTDYTVTMLTTSAGNVKRLAGNLPSGCHLTLLLDLPYTQPISIRNQGEFYEDVHERAFDRNVLLLKQLQEIVSRSVVLPETMAGGDGTVKNLIPGYALGINAAGDGLECVPNSGASQVADMANTTEATRGSGMLGHNDALVYPDGSTGAFLNKLKSYASALAGAGMSGFSYALAYAANTVGAAIKAVMDRCTALEGMSVGQCRLVYVDAATIKLQRFNGKYLMINGGWQVIPATGVTLFSTGLSATTLYYVYAYMSGSTLTLEASATGHSTDATTGVEIKTGDASRTLVGMVYCLSAATFADSSKLRLVKSYFNRQYVSAKNIFTTQRTTSSTTVIELNSEIRIQFLVWYGEMINCSLNAIIYNSATNNTYFGLGMDSTANYYNDINNGTYGSNTVPSSFSGQSDSLSEGPHYATCLGRVSGGTGYFGLPVSIFLGLNN